MVRACVAAALAFGLIISLPVAARAEDEAGALLTTVQFERSLHFQTPAGEAVVVPAGTYAVKAEGQQGLRLEGKGQGPWLVHAMAGTHEGAIDQPFALALPYDSSLQLTHLGLLLPDGRMLQSTGSTDGVMPRLIPTHIIVAMFKTAMTGTPMKPAMQVDLTATGRANPIGPSHSLRGCARCCANATRTAAPIPGRAIRRNR